MENKLPSNEEKKLRTERADLIAQSEEFLKEDAYELLPELFIQVAQISLKLGEQDIADEFSNRAEKIRALIEAPAVPAAPAAPSAEEVPIWSPDTYPTLPSPEPDTEPTFPSPEPDIEPTLPSPESDAESPSKEALSDKLQKLKGLVNVIPNSQLAPELASPPEKPIDPLELIFQPSQEIHLENSMESLEPEPLPPPTQEIPPSPSQSTNLGSLIEQRRREVGILLESGIIPTVVRSEEEILFELLSEKLPLMPYEEKENAVKKLLTYTKGPSRDAWLKVFLIKNKRYAKKEE